MSLRGQIALGLRVAGALGRLGADRIAEAFGRALPRTPEQLAEPSALDKLLREHASRGEPPPAVVAARLPGVVFESSNCTNFLVEVDFEGEAAPRTLYAKLPCAERATRAFANAVGFWESEVAFCRRLADRVPIRVPRVHAAARRGARFVLLLENLGAAPDVRLFVNRDMAAGTTPERARACIRTFAELHAAFWGMPKADREALLPLRLHTYLQPGGRAVSRALNAAAIGPTRRDAPDLFTAEHAEVCRLAIAKWDALIDWWYAEPLTLIHGDSHLANCFEYAAEGGPRIGMIDFQGVSWCKGVRDVQYHLIDSLEPDVLAGCEEALIDAYVDDLASHGVALARADAREQYRALSFQTLMVAVVSFGLGSLTERDETLRTVLRRSTAAIDRLRVGDWLEAL